MERTESVRASAAPAPAAAFSPKESDMPPDPPRAGLFAVSLPSSSLRCARFAPATLVRQCAARQRFLVVKWRLYRTRTWYQKRNSFCLCGDSTGTEEKRGKKGGMPEPEEEEEQETLTADVYQKAKGWSLCDAAATHLGLRAVMQNY